MQPASSGGRRLRHAALAARKFVLEPGRTVTRKELSAAAREAGNAAVDNYKGKVRRKLSRARRYPAEARRQGLRGVAHVRFTVSSDGGLVSVSLTKSAGSPILDEAALDAVRRAAPFPPIPESAGRNSWVFDIPLDFRR